MKTEPKLTPADIFPKLGSGADWSNVRKTANYLSTSPVTDVNSEAIRCYQAGPGAQGSTTTTVSAGGSITFGASPNIFHPGPMSGWMAKVPDGQTAASWDGSGKVWFKVYQEMPSIGSGGMTWASESRCLLFTKCYLHEGLSARSTVCRRCCLQLQPVLQLDASICKPVLWFLHASTSVPRMQATSRKSVLCRTSR